MAGKKSPTKLQQLELQNDLALIEFWKATERVEECKDELNNTSEALALREAEWELTGARVKMTKVRYEYLQAKVNSR